MALFRSFWHGGPLSPYEELCLASFVRQGHRFELFTYDPALVVPAGVVRRDAAAILPQDRIYFYEAGLGRGSVAGFANLFRYTLLAREPGWWVDTDVLCLRPDPPQAPCFFAWEGPDLALVGNAILRLPPGDALLPAMLAARDSFAPDQPWGTAGPHLLTATLRQAGRLGQVAAHGVAYPWHFTEAFAVFDPDRVEEVAEAVGAACFQHLWNEMFRCGGLPKWLAPPAGSYLDRQCRAHGIVFPPGPRLRQEDLQRQARVTRAAQGAEAAQAEAARLAAELARNGAQLAQLEARCRDLQASHAAERRMRLALAELHDALLARLRHGASPAWRRWLGRCLRASSGG
ncbi:glycosyltransferase family 32 protein [Falsiroseomonas tokyonensis]|uniref:Alpha 1,4-glycosyltransferase domain-containing protein n=1 Tax=Falsiroseomonas tokyonensis TaxID=430521 RepID=A0ABV7BQD7_9PROT|nr:hypothetical protein [Falsiroseomonas tokyonensis]MBU8536857.1 hypothetical protein [Falsiroseomonas tokyonensis]